MSLNSKTSRLAALLLVLGGALYFKFLYVPGPSDSNIVDEIFYGEAEWDRPYIEIGERKPYVPPDTSSIFGIPRDTWTAPTSNWLVTQKATASDQLRALMPTILVVPVQGDVNTFDTIARSLMTRIVNEQIALDEDQVVLPTTPVLRYFGSHKASYTDDEIWELARISLSERVLTLYAEHDRKGNWELTAELFDREKKRIGDKKTWSNLTYTDAAPPSVALQEIQDEIARFATGEAKKQRREEFSVDADTFKIPDSVGDLVERASASPLEAAAILQFLATLHPADEDNDIRIHLFERSVLELASIAPESDYYNYFKARAYLALGRRPAAVALLAAPQNEHEVALAAYLNGNLLDLRENSDKFGTSMLDFMAWKDLMALEWRYEKEVERDLEDKFSAASPIWSNFFIRSLNELDTWSRSSMVSMKLSLEDLLPSKDASLVDRATSMLLTGGDMGELELTRMVFRNIESIVESAPHERQDRLQLSRQVSVHDLLDLVRSIAVSNHIARIKRSLETKGVPASALEEISTFESLFSGHPEVTILKGRAQSNLSKESEGVERQNLIALSSDSLLNGFTWTGVMTPYAAEVARDYADLLELGSYNGPKIKRGNYLASFSSRYFELPRGPQWYKRIDAGESTDGAFERCIDYTITTFNCLRFLIDKQQRGAEEPGAVRDELLAQYSNRFQGHPILEQYQVEISRYSADASAEVDLLRSQIETGNAGWETYKQLGRLFLRSGNYKEAQEIWLSYPGFLSNSSDHRVTSSNSASVVGSWLYWVGQYELAEPLLEVSVGFGGGSANFMGAAQRLAMITGDIENSIAWSAERVRRYDSAFGIRDLMQLLHVVGESEIAWTVFDETLSSKSNSQMWSGALVGHRASSATLAEASTWIQESEARKTARVNGNNNDTVDLAARYLLMVGTMDRVPTSDLAEIVNAAHTTNNPFYMKTRPLVDPNGVEIRGWTAHLVGRFSHMKHDPLVPTPRDEQRRDNGDAIDHRYTMLARAMTAFEAADYKKAFMLFNETAYFHLLDEYLPYHTFSASMIDQNDHLREALLAREPSLDQIRKRERSDEYIAGYRFDEDLSYAVLAAFDGDHNAAISYLRGALNNKPYIIDRSIYPMYQLVDLAERLYRHTGEEVYREFALDLSRRHTVILPMYAWAYFVVAKYSTSANEQIESAASGLHLDPLSSRIEQLPAEIVDKAKARLAKDGPPFLESSTRQSAEST